MTVGTSCDCNSGIVTVKLLDKGQVVASAKGVQGKELRLSVQNPTLWSPSNPYLYDMTVSLSKDGKVLDEVKSYTAFRKISSKRDAAGIMRMQLNNQDLFQFGPLDQDGGLTDFIRLRQMKHCCSTSRKQKIGASI
mgnify:CR=1 FL=1